MGYINFEEESFVAKNQLQKRKSNNKTLFDSIIRHKNLPKTYNPCKQYSYKTFTNEHIGRPGTLDEDIFSTIENEDIVCAKFIGCKFKNLTFKECRFIGCVFEDCKFESGGVTFENCTFLKEDTQSKPSLNKYDNLSCQFKNCNIYSKFLNCILSFSIFENCKMVTTNFEQSEMENVIIIDCDLDMIVISDCDLSGAKVIATYIKDLEFRDKFQTKLDEKSFFDKIPTKFNNKDEYEGIYMTYETLADKFQENNLNNNFGEYYYLCKKTQRKTLSPLPKIWSFLYYITCGYGERPEFAVYSSLVLIFLFAVIYLFTGVEINNQTVIYNFTTIKSISLPKIFNDLNETLTLSVGSFGGVGTINCKPTQFSYLVNNLEVIIGIIMMGLGIGTLTRKVVR